MQFNEYPKEWQSAAAILACAALLGGEIRRAGGVNVFLSHRYVPPPPPPLPTYVQLPTIALAWNHSIGRLVDIEDDGD